MRHFGSRHPPAHPQARRGGRDSRQPARREPQDDGLRRLRARQHHAARSETAVGGHRGAEEGSGNRGMPLHHRSGQHPREALLRGQRTPDADDFRRHPAHPGPRLDRNHDLAAGGFPARNQHRLHRGVTPPGPPNPVRSVSEYHPEHSGVVFFSADGTLRPPDIPLI